MADRRGIFNATEAPHESAGHPRRITTVGYGATDRLTLTTVWLGDVFGAYNAAARVRVSGDGDLAVSVEPAVTVFHSDYSPVGGLLEDQGVQADLFAVGVSALATKQLAPRRFLSCGLGGGYATGTVESDFAGGPTNPGNLIGALTWQDGLEKKPRVGYVLRAAGSAGFSGGTTLTASPIAALIFASGSFRADVGGGPSVVVAGGEMEVGPHLALDAWWQF